MRLYYIYFLKLKPFIYSQIFIQQNMCIVILQYFLQDLLVSEDSIHLGYPLRP